MMRPLGGRAAFGWYALAAGILALDQLTKGVATAYLDYGESVAALPFLAWTFACNTGVAFSLFEGFSSAFAVVAVVVGAYLAFEIWRWRGGGTRGLVEGAAYACVLGGALGNLTDRLLHGCVVDFVHVRYDWFNFPVFNVADSAITIGAAAWIGLVLLDIKGGAGAPSDKENEAG